MKRFVHTSAVAAALFCTTALVNPAQAQSPERAVQVFFNSAYTYCDAKLLGDLWRTDAYDGKVTIGSKIINGIEENLRVDLDSSRRNGNKCDWSDTGYSYQDAEVLGQYWNTDTYDAKILVADKLTYGLGYEVDRQLQQARKQNY